MEDDFLQNDESDKEDLPNTPQQVEKDNEKVKARLMEKKHYAFSLKTSKFVNVSLNQLVGEGEHGKRVKETVVEDETIVAITDPSRKSLSKLFRAFKLNPLLL